MKKILSSLLSTKLINVLIVLALIGIAYFIGAGSNLFRVTESGISEDEARQIALEVQAENQVEQTSKTSDDEMESKKKTKTKSTQTPKEKKSKSINQYKKYLDAIFYDTGKRYVMNNSEFKFYSDMSCDKEFLISKKLTFINSLDLEIKNDNGFTVYISRSTDGYVCSVEKPYFNECSVD